MNQGHSNNKGKMTDEGLHTKATVGVRQINALYVTVVDYRQMDDVTMLKPLRNPMSQC